MQALLVFLRVSEIKMLGKQITRKQKGSVTLERICHPRTRLMCIEGNRWAGKPNSRHGGHKFRSQDAMSWGIGGTWHVSGLIRRSTPARFTYAGLCPGLKKQKISMETSTMNDLVSHFTVFIIGTPLSLTKRTRVTSSETYATSKTRIRDSSVVESQPFFWNP